LFGVFSRTSAWGRALELLLWGLMLTVSKVKASKKFEIP
jgi:hypothetical protein